MKSQSSFQLYLLVAVFSLVFLANIKTVEGQTGDNKNRSEGNFGSHLFFGGTFGLQFGSVTLIELSPLVGYKVTPKLGIGVSPTFKYYTYQYSSASHAKVENNIYGGSIFARYLILENIFAHVEYESLIYNMKIPGYPKDMRQFNSFLVGGGYRQQIGGNAAMNLMVLWNLNDTYDSPYTNPIIRIGFSAGF